MPIRICFSQKWEMVYDSAMKDRPSSDSRTWESEPDASYLRLQKEYPRYADYEPSPWTVRVPWRRVRIFSVSSVAPIIFFVLYNVLDFEQLTGWVRYLVGPGFLVSLILPFIAFNQWGHLWKWRKVWKQRLDQSGEWLQAARGAIRGFDVGDHVKGTDWKAWSEFGRTLYSMGLYRESLQCVLMAKQADLYYLEQDRDRFKEIPNRVEHYESTIESATLWH